jgi:hypothetical protein
LVFQTISFHGWLQQWQLMQREGFIIKKIWDLNIRKINSIVKIIHKFNIWVYEIYVYNFLLKKERKTNI